MLVEGELDALIHPELIQPILDKDKRVTRLFPNYRDLEMDYYKRTGIFPIMHTTAIKQEIVDKYPWVPINLIKRFKSLNKQPTNEWKIRALFHWPGSATF